MNIVDHSTQEPALVLQSMIFNGGLTLDIMISISLCKAGVEAILIFCKLSIPLLVSTLHNNING